MLSSAKWDTLQVFPGVNKVSVARQVEVLQVFPGVHKVSVVYRQGGDFAGIPWGTQGQCCLTPRGRFCRYSLG